MGMQDVFMYQKSMSEARQNKIRQGLAMLADHAVTETDKKTIYNNLVDTYKNEYNVDLTPLGEGESWDSRIMDNAAKSVKSIQDNKDYTQAVKNRLIQGVLAKVGQGFGGDERLLWQGFNEDEKYQREKEDAENEIQVREMINKTMNGEDLTKKEGENLYELSHTPEGQKVINNAITKYTGDDGSGTGSSSGMVQEQTPATSNTGQSQVSSEQDTTQPGSQATGMTTQRPQPMSQPEPQSTINTGQAPEQTTTQPVSQATGMTVRDSSVSQNRQVPQPSTINTGGMTKQPEAQVGRQASITQTPQTPQTLETPDQTLDRIRRTNPIVYNKVYKEKLNAQQKLADKKNEAEAAIYAENAKEKYKIDAKRWNETRESYEAAGNKARASLGQVAVLEELLKNVDTGMGADYSTWLQRAASMFPGVSYNDKIGAKEAFKSLTAQLTMEAGFGGEVGGKMVRNLPGNMSDNDVALLGKVVPQLTNTKEGNLILGLIMRKKADRAILLSKWAEDWRREHKGDMEGFAEKAQEYADNHPMFENLDLKSGFINRLFAARGTLKDYDTYYAGYKNALESREIPRELETQDNLKESDVVKYYKGVGLTDEQAKDKLRELSGQFDVVGR